MTATNAAQPDAQPAHDPLRELLASLPAGGRHPLGSGVDVVAIDWPQFKPLFEAYRGPLFTDTLGVSIDQVVSEAEQEQLRQRRERFPVYRACLVALRGDRLVGWSYGGETKLGVFHMYNSAVVAEERRRGVYSALVRHMLQVVRAEGFQLVQSNHVATNNAVIIAKLKLGFVITGVELSDLFGSLAQLTYYMNPQRQRLLEVRVGQARPDESLRRVLKLD